MLNAYLEESCGPALRSIFAEGVPTYFRLTDEPDVADVIVFQREDWNYLRKSKLQRRYPLKCICISEWDKPSFFIPGIYASNERRWLAKGRAETTTYLVAARDPLNKWIAKLSGEPAEKKYLYSFIGKSSNALRRKLLRRTTQASVNRPDDILIEASDEHVHNFVHYGDAIYRRYAEIMLASKYSLCPGGMGVSSVRLFESCEMGVAPVILADRWVPIAGIDWAFAIFVEEDRLPELDRIIRSHESEWAQRGRGARQTFQQYFAKDAAARNLAAAISRLIGQLDPQREMAVRRLYPLLNSVQVVKNRLRKWRVL